MEDTDDDSPAVPFEASTAAGLHAAAPTGSTLSPFNHDYVLSHTSQFDQNNALYGGAESGRVEVPSNHLPDDPPGLSARPSSKPDPFRGFTSSSFADFMRAYSSTGRQPHSASGGPPFASSSFDSPPDTVLGSKLVQGQVYYLPSDTPGGHPIPAVIMPLSRLRELHAALPSGKKPVYNLPPDASPAPDAPFKSPSFADFPFKSFGDAPFKSSVFSESPFKSEAPFKTSQSQSSFPSLPDSPFKGPPSSFGGDHRGPPPSKYRPSSPFKGKDPFFKQSGGFPRPQPHHLSGFSKPHGLRFGPSPSGPSPTGSSVKITKSVPVFEEHQTLSKHPHQPQHQGSSPVAAAAEEPNPALQWPPKESVDVQTYYMPIEQYDGLKGNPLVSSGHRPSFHHGHPRGPPTLHREVRRPPPHRPVRAHLPSPQPSAAPSHHHHSHGQLEPGAFAVSSSYRVRPSG
ncbi:extensin-like [Thrips palmi]|uniref:Extensin-like n=1 Tax=Thrips palmi TaxID=161013 RepID=A0A6P8YDY1_THRPL|nr:extensin-like [Thrips palmi]